jgi:hypothetical protein
VRDTNKQLGGHKPQPDSRKGHENIATVQIYLHADLAIKEKALALAAPPGSVPGRFRPSDPLLAFLEAL